MATNFTPMNGEIIIYDEDDNYNYKRIKIGNGTDNVNDLDFIKNENNEDCLRFIEQDLDNSEIIQVLSNLNLVSFCELRNSSIVVKKDDFNENGVCYFNERNISIMPEDFGFYEYRLSFSFSSYEEIGLPMEVGGNQHPSTAPIQFKDFILIRDQIYTAREDVEIPDKMYIMPGKLILNYNTNSIYSVGFNKSELEDGTKVAYFSETFEKISEK